MSARRRKGRRFPHVRVRAHRTLVGWVTLATRAGLSEEACDERLCAKLAKSRKRASRNQRRAVRRLLGGAGAHRPDATPETGD